MAQSATVAIEGADSLINLTPVASGIRNKKIVFNIPVYVMQLFVADPASFEKASLLKSAAAQKSLAIHMTFLRDVDNGRILGSFHDCLASNDLDPDQGALKQLLELVKKSGDVKKGGTMTVYLESKAGAVRLFLESQNLQSMNGDKAFGEQVLSMWLGKPNDSGIRAMQKELAGSID